MLLGPNMRTRDRDPGRAGGRQLFKRRAGIQDGALPLLSREAPDYVSLEGYITANVMIEGLKRTGPMLQQRAKP